MSRTHRSRPARRAAGALGGSSDTGSTSAPPWTNGGPGCRGKGKPAMAVAERWGAVEAGTAGGHISMRPHHVVQALAEMDLFADVDGGGANTQSPGLRAEGSTRWSNRPSTRDKGARIQAPKLTNQESHSATNSTSHTHKPSGVPGPNPAARFLTHKAFEITPFGLARRHNGLLRRQPLLVQPQSQGRTTNRSSGSCSPGSAGARTPTSPPLPNGPPVNN